MLYTWNLLNIINQLCQSKKNLDGRKKETVLWQLEKNEVRPLLHIIYKISTQNEAKEHT